MQVNFILIKWIQWIGSYTRDREQFAIAGGERAVRAHCAFGVPQGSMLGPFRFSVYVSSIADHITWRTVPTIRPRHSVIYCGDVRVGCYKTLRMLNSCKGLVRTK